MEDNDLIHLKLFFPKFGDRLAIKSYVKAFLKTSQKEDRENYIFEHLKEKISQKIATGSHFTRSKKQLGNVNAKRLQRRVEVGWMEYIYERETFKQVYQRTGGGIKHEKFCIATTMDEIKKCCKNIVFSKWKM